MRKTLSLALAAALVAAAPSRAGACINSVMSLDETIAAVQDAERKLNDGDPDAARDRLPDVEHELSAMEMKGSPSTSLRERVTRIRALADVRLDPGGPAEGGRLATRLAAVTALQKLADEHPADAARQTDLAEALARTRPAEAKPLLEDLAARDLVTTPYGYVTLARLRAADGDARGRDEALARCRPMAKSASICALQPTPLWFKRMIPVGAVALGAAALGALAGALRRARARRAQRA